MILLLFIPAVIVDKNQLQSKYKNQKSILKLTSLNIKEVEKVFLTGKFPFQVAHTNFSVDFLSDSDRERARLA